MAGSYREISIPVSRVGNILKLQSRKGNHLVTNISSKVFEEKGGGFNFSKYSKLSANRRISWRYFDNIIELEEISDDYNLFNNKVQITVSDEFLLPNVVIKENGEELLVFLATTSSVHTLSFQHPNHQKYGFIIPQGMDVSLPSLFHNINNNLNHTQHELSQPCFQFDVSLSKGGNINYGLVTEANTLLSVELVEGEECNITELKETSLAQRLWTGFVPSFVRGESANWMGAESVVMESLEDEAYAFTICKDLKIRVWSITTQTCILTKDLVEHIPDKLDSQPNMVGTLSLKKSEKDSSDSQFKLAAHCCLLYGSQFLVMECFKEESNLVMVHVSNFFSDHTNVQDFVITNHRLWSCWKNEDEHQLCYAPIEGGREFERGWHDVHLKASQKEELFIGIFQDAKEAYLKKIFTPNFASSETILKALQVYVKTIDSGHEFIPANDCNLPTLKESIVAVLDLEVERNTLNRELEVAEFQEINAHCWSRFYSIILQCLQSRDAPLGLHINETDGKAYIIRKECEGMCSELPWVDHLYQSDLTRCEAIQGYVEMQLDTAGDSINEDIVLLFDCLKSIPEQFNGDVILGIDKDLDGNEDVKTFLSSMASCLITNTSDFEQLVGDSVERGDYYLYLEGRLKNIKDIKRAVDFILNALDVVDPATGDESEIESSGLSGEQNQQIFCSKLGVKLVTNLLLTTAESRMHLCRDLYVLLKFMSTMAGKVGIDLSDAREFESLTSSTCYELLRSYHTIVWAATNPMTTIDPNVVDNNITNLAALRLAERSPASKTARKIDETVNTDEESILSHFVDDVGLLSAVKKYRSPHRSSIQDVMNFIKNSCLNQLWVLNDKSSDFPEYLAAHGQYALLNEYLHFCDEWCLVNRGTKDFLLAQSYLGTDQPHKALKYFISAARGISLREPLLMNILEDENCSSKQHALVQYFIKVMRLFEHYNFPSFVISAASSALTIAKKDEPNIPMLWSVIFKYHLELQHHNEAYAAIVHNPDKARRENCLRHFIITLCDRGLFHEICTYPYVNLQEEVVSIIESRARTMDMTVNRFYDLLYSFHTIKSDYRKAATTMYEQACRLQVEMHGLKSLQKQAKCYLASITALQLVDSKYAWIVRPEEKISQQPSPVPGKAGSNVNEYSQSPKRREDGEQIFYSTMKKRRNVRTVIVELNDLEKEYLLVLARLKLVQHGKNETVAIGPGLSASETIGLLSQLGLFDMSFSVALKFNLPLKGIFEALASKCANLMKYKPSEFDERWNWLTLNEINSIQLVTSKSATQQALHLLQSYLKKFSKQNSSLHLKVVASKFLSINCELPSWLIKDYKTANPAELLHLYICYDMVSEATELSLGYIDAVLGHGKEQFGLNTALHATTPPVWLPYTAFDQILKPLRSNQDNPELATLLQRLETKLEEYFNQLEITTCDKIEYVSRTQQRMM